jgi:hypothetical protein
LQSISNGAPFCCKFFPFCSHQQLHACTHSLTQNFVTACEMPSKNSQTAEGQFAYLTSEQQMRTRIRKNPDGWTAEQLQTLYGQSFKYATYQVYRKPRSLGQPSQMAFRVLDGGSLAQLCRSLEFEPTPSWQHATLSFENPQLLQMLLLSFSGDEADLITSIEFVSEAVWNTSPNLRTTARSVFPQVDGMQEPEWWNPLDMALKASGLPNLNRVHVQLRLDPSHMMGTRSSPEQQADAVVDIARKQLRRWNRDLPNLEITTSRNKW